MKRRMDGADEGKDATRHRLLIAAGELFAQRGFDATSVRDIARKSKTNIAAVNYHYATKDNLYLAVVQYVADKMVARRDKALDGMDARTLDQSQAVGVLRELIEREARAYMSADLPEWYAQLLLRALLAKGPALEFLFARILHPDHVVLRQLLRAAAPRLTEQDATLWAYSITGQIVFYCLGREAILIEQKRTEYSDSFVRAVADHVVRVVLSGIGLADQPAKAGRRPSRNP
ncbi:MAG TPA: CerR family C-terminal domain-containing protein [Candidatus Hydrogenedentes bacterium]|nr:CerR family C-terminal domain-containing protein [Candidatus Hydrogenedentota bacterium]HPC15615.1 CerR family C-terminal domain-containing protein [Candidatus Hydrogenedentota bacterium]HRT19435.1 CerR family C-terminal domain-containing protein [Candidatus Hydrogenedentota bacterium]HRT63831.1 CerR family C-terminal domain-containing protein [Candidatus Hydrogenedentota bacterium]